MKAITLMRYGSAHKAFKSIEVPDPKIGDEEILIKAQAFGLNYADVMARNGLYADAPPLPAVLGYEVIGHVEAVGVEVRDLKVGDRVLAFTRFGAYAEKVVASMLSTVKIKEEYPNEVLALATQYCTAIHAAYGMANIYEGDHVLIHAAAGGVGTALVQFALRRGCIVYGTCGSTDKVKYLESIGVHYPINYRRTSFMKEIAKIRPGGVDVIFDPVGGASFSNDRKILAYGGRIICYGVSSRSGGGIWKTLKLVFGFGFLHPIGLLMKSQGVLGVNMLRIADEKPHILQKSLKHVVKFYKKGIIKPYLGASFPVDKITEAHHLLESRESIGKIIVEW